MIVGYEGGRHCCSSQAIAVIACRNPSFFWPALGKSLLTGQARFRLGPILFFLFDFVIVVLLLLL